MPVDVYDKDVLLVDGDREETLDGEVVLEGEPRPTEHYDRVGQQRTHALLIALHLTAIMHNIRELTIILYTLNTFFIYSIISS